MRTGIATIFVLILIILTLASSVSAGFYIAHFFSDKNKNQDRPFNPEQVLSKIKEKDLAGKKDAEKPVYLKDFRVIREGLLQEGASFVEANLAKMNISFYRQGSLEKEIPISAKGDPQGWGGSAAGLYQIISGYKLGYSAIAEVYMPYALNYYGKYYIHGEPYYPGGERRITDITGGCIQLSDEDAKAVYEFTEIGMPVLVIDKENDDYQYSNEKASEFPEVSAKNYLVADLGSGFVFAKKDSRSTTSIASLTKLMTAVVVSEKMDLRRFILVRPEMLNSYGSTTGLEAGKRFGVVELFYPLLIESSNDAAEVLSYFFGKENTIRLMNEKARSILMENTEFASPDGYDPKNISTAEDLFYLARYILNNRPPILEITKGKNVQTFGEVDFKNLDNKNLFFNDQNFVGGKTGYIIASKYTGLFIFKFQTKAGEERKIVIILLGSDGLKEGEKSLEKEVQNILNWLKEDYF